MDQQNDSATPEQCEAYARSMTPKKLKRGDAVRVVDGSEAQGNIGVVLDFLPGGYAAIKLADCVRPVNPDKTEPLGPLPVMRRWVVELE